MTELTANKIQSYKTKSLSQLKATAKVWFHLFVRLRDRIDENSFVCCSCGKIKPIVGDNYQAGHYHSAGHNGAIEFDERNVNGQCKKCNTFDHGYLIGYQKFMLKKYGQSVLDELEMKRNLPFKPDRFYFIDIIETYKIKTKEFSNII